MRQMMRLVEASAFKTPKARPVDVGALRTRLAEVIATLAREPFALRYDRTLSDRLLAEARRLREQNLRDVQEEPGMTPNSMEEIMEEAMRVHTLSKFGSPGTDDFNIVAGEVDLAEHGENNQGGGYQSRRAEAAGREDDLDFYIEDSDYLRGMAAQKALASGLAHRDFNSAGDTLAALDLIGRFAQAFSDHHAVTDGGEEPYLVDSMRDGLSKLMPLLKARWTAA